MDTPALFGAISLGVIGFLILSLEAAGFTLMRRAYGESAGRLGILAVLVLGLCAFVMLMSGLVRARKMTEPHRVSQKLETVSYRSVEWVVT